MDLSSVFWIKHYAGKQPGTNTPLAWVRTGNLSLKERYDPHNTVGYREQEREREVRFYR